MTEKIEKKKNFLKKQKKKKTHHDDFGKTKFVKTKKLMNERRKFKTFLDVEEYIKTKQKIYLNKVNSAIFSMKY